MKSKWKQKKIVHKENFETALALQNMAVVH